MKNNKQRYQQKTFPEKKLLELPSWYFRVEDRYQKKENLKYFLFGILYTTFLVLSLIFIIVNVGF